MFRLPVDVSARVVVESVFQVQDEGSGSPAHIVCGSVSPPEPQPGGPAGTGREMWRYVSVSPPLCSVHKYTEKIVMPVSAPLPAACRALVDEMEWAISQIDPKKMIQTGSFRINPDGSQSIREVRLQQHIDVVVVWVQPTV